MMVLSSLHHLCELLLAILPACAIAILFVFITWVFKKVNVIGNPRAHVVLYALYVSIVFLAMLIYVNLDDMNIDLFNCLMRASLFIVSLLMLPILRATVERIGLDGLFDQRFTLCCCAAALFFTMIDFSNNQIVEALSLAFAFCSVASASSFVFTNKSSYRKRREEK